MFTARFHTLLAGGALLLASATLDAQTITAIDVTEATLGEVVRVTGAGLGSKPKLVLAQEGAATKKTKLKVVGAGTDADEDFVDFEIKKAFAGAFQVAVKKGKTLTAISPDTFEIVGPRIDSVNPTEALPNDLVDVFVEHAGTGKLKALVGSKKAKITNIEPADEDGGGFLSRVTIKVPKVPDGTWPVTFQNLIGIDALKAALDVNGSTTALGKPSASVTIEGRKPFKAKKNNIAVDNMLDATNIGAVQGKKNLIVSLPENQADLVAGSSWNAAPANIFYSEATKQGQIAWAAEPAAEGASWAIDLIELTEDTIVTYICGKLTRVTGEGPETLCVYGVVISPRIEVDTTTEPCDVHFHADMSVIGPWDAAPGDDGTGAVYNDLGGNTTQLEGDKIGAGGLSEGFNIIMSFDPTTQNSAVITGAFALQGFAFTDADGSWASIINPDLSTSMTVTITDVLAPTDPQDPWAGYIVGSFDGTLKSNTSPLTQTCSGDFCSPYLLLSDPGTP